MGIRNEGICGYQKGPLPNHHADYMGTSVNDTSRALTFDGMSTANRSRARRWHPNFPNDGVWTGSDWSNAFAGEAGEACNIVKKLRRDECGLRGLVDPPQEGLLEKLALELADAVLYADLLAAYYHIDLPAAIIEKFNRVSELQGFPERLGDEA